MLTEFGKTLRIIRINSGDSAKEMAAKLNMSPSYLSTIENGKRNIPPGLDRTIIDIYNLSEEDSERLRISIANSSNVLKIDLMSLEGRERKIIIELTKGELDDDKLDKLYRVINENQ